MYQWQVEEEKIDQPVIYSKYIIYFFINGHKHYVTVYKDKKVKTTMKRDRAIKYTFPIAERIQEWLKSFNVVPIITEK
jgi:hypothetical protein